MARFTQDLVLNKPDDFVQFIMNDYLTKHGYAISDWKGEQAYRAGDGFVEGFKYLKWSYAGGVFHLEAWMKGSFGKEMNLEGFVAAVPKKQYKSNLKMLFEALKQPLPEQAQSGGPQSGPGYQPGLASNPIPVKTVDNYQTAMLALIPGILSIVAGLLIPLAGIILACVGLPMARMGQGSSKAGAAKAARICSIVGLSLSAINWILKIILDVLQIALW